MEGLAQGVWLRLNMPPTDAAVGARGHIPTGLRSPSGALRQAEKDSVDMDLSGQRHGQGAKRGDHTGPNPTDRAKKGVKRHILTDGRGVPLAAEITGANVHDKWLVGKVLDAVVVRRLRRPVRPKNLCLDKGYDYADAEKAVRDRGVIPHIRRRGEDPLLGVAHGKPRRWVVERTNAWHNRFRGLLIRWERKSHNYLAMLHLACGLIAFQQS